MGAPDFSSIASMQEQLREYYSRKILAVYPEMVNHPDIQFGNTYELYIRMVNEGLIPEVANPGEIVNSIPSINVKSAAVTGGGVVDDTAAIQAVINANPGRRFYFPRGTYLISSPIIITSSNTVIDCEAGAEFLSASPTLTSFFLINGAAWGPSVELATAVDTGALTITTKTAHGLAVGDVIRIKSQRVSTSVDAGEWQLGWSTGTTQGPFFAEFATVYSVTSSTVFTLDTGLTFPGYRPDNTQETHPAAGTSATVAKFNPVRNVRIINPTFKGTSATIASGSGASIIFTAAMDCSIEGARYPKRPTDGRFIQIVESFRVEARDCFIQNDYVITLDVEHHYTNSYHIIGSQACGFVRCDVIRGSQCFDITYSNAYLTTSNFCYVKDCTSRSALFNALTTHPGVYGGVISGNDFSECRESGIAIRSNKTIVSDNIVSGSGDAGWGLAISEGGGKDTIFQRNIVTNFRYSMGVRDSTGKWYAGWIGVIFDNNVFENFLWGFYRNTDAAAPVVTSSQGVIIRNNTFKSDRVSAIGVKTAVAGSYINGIDIVNNHFKLTSSSSTAVEATANSQNINVKGNIIDLCKNILTYDSSVARTIVEKTKVTWKNNEIWGATSTLMPNCTADFMYGGDMEIHTLGTTITLTEFQMSGKFRASALANASIANGFPIDSFNGWVEVIRQNSSSVFQFAYYQNGTTVNIYTHRWNGSSWTAWTLFTA